MHAERITGAGRPPLPGSGSRRSVALTVLVGAAAALAGGALQVELAGVRPPAGAVAPGSACSGGAEYEVDVARWGAALPGRLLDLLGPREAQADEVLPQIEAFLEQYRRATEARDVAALGAMYEAFSPEQRAALERYFGGVRDLRVGIDHVEAAVVGDEAAVTYARTDDFVDVQTGRPGHVAVRLTKTLRRVDGRWLFATSR